ncbi:MAG TPA: type IV pilus biogenesis/stability protein PilW [Burkholderiales bacterium]|nr:type IV pilus biogenesis/stability protein PilW [Burkholderiales bacterium]
MKRYHVFAVLLLASWLAGCASSAERQAEEERRQRLADTHVQLGASYLQRGQLEAAKENLEKAVELEPDSVRANNMMALLQWRLKNYPQAERYFRKSLSDREAKGNSDAWNNFGVFLCERGQFDTAEQAFQRALADPLYTTPVEANVNAGLCQMRKPSPAVAEKYFRAALEINPRHPRALVELARISYDTGRSLSARAFMQRFFAIAEDTPDALLLASKIEGALGNRDTEASYAVRLRGKFPESQEASRLKDNDVSKKSGKKP